MNNTKRTYLKPLLMAFVLASSPITGAYAACCAGHGGVASCNTTTGYKTCKDGTASPSCTCKKAKKASTKKTTSSTSTLYNKNNTKTNTQKNTKTPSHKHWWSTGTTGATGTTKSSNSTKSTGNSRGCCSRHGGIAQCNTSTGYQMCKDGTQSSSCTCH